MGPVRLSDTRPAGGAPAWFHVVQRGVGRRPVFARGDDVRSILAGLQLESERSGVELHAYSVLTNHCHLLVRGQPEAVSAAMRRVFAVCALRINRRLHRDGPLFGSVLIGNARNTS